MASACSAKPDLQAELDILNKLSTELGRMMRAGFGPEDVLAANPAKDYVARMGDPRQLPGRIIQGHVAAQRA